MSVLLNPPSTPSSLWIKVLLIDVDNMTMTQTELLGGLRDWFKEVVGTSANVEVQALDSEAETADTKVLVGVHMMGILAGGVMK